MSGVTGAEEEVVRALTSKDNVAESIEDVSNGDSSGVTEFVGSSTTAEDVCEKLVGSTEMGISDVGFCETVGSAAIVSSGTRVGAATGVIVIAPSFWRSISIPERSGDVSDQREIGPAETLHVKKNNKNSWRNISEITSDGSARILRERVCGKQTDDQTEI